MNYFQIPISESQISAPQDDNKSFFQQLGIDMGWDCTPFDPPFPAYSAYSGDPSLDTYGDSAEYSGEIGSVDNASQGTKRSYDDPNWQDDWSTMDRGGKRQRVYGSTGPENSLDTAQFQAQALGDKSHSSHAGSIPTESHQAPGSLSTTQTNERSGTETKNDEDQIVASATTNKQEMLRVLRTPWTRYKPGKVPDELMQYAKGRKIPLRWDESTRSLVHYDYYNICPSCVRSANEELVGFEEPRNNIWANETGVFWLSNKCAESATCKAAIKSEMPCMTPGLLTASSQKSKRYRQRVKSRKEKRSSLKPILCQYGLDG